MSDVDSARGRAQVAGIRELMFLHQAVMNSFGRALRPLGLTLTHVSFLSNLAAEGGSSPVSEVAAAMEVNQPAVSKTMKTLVSMGAVVSRGDTDDARRRSAHLTDEGWDLLRDAQLAMHPVADIGFGALSDARLDEFIEMGAQVRGRLDAAI